MPLHAKDAGAWSDSIPWAKDAGVWIHSKAWIKQAGIWVVAHQPANIGGNWGTSPLLVSHTVADPADAEARVEFDYASAQYGRWKTVGDAGTVEGDWLEGLHLTTPVPQWLADDYEVGFTVDSGSLTTSPGAQRPTFHSLGQARAFAVAQTSVGSGFASITVEVRKKTDTGESISRTVQLTAEVT